MSFDPILSQLILISSLPFLFFGINFILSAMSCPPSGTGSCYPYTRLRHVFFFVQIINRYPEFWRLSDTISSFAVFLSLFSSTDIYLYVRFLHITYTIYYVDVRCARMDFLLEIAKFRKDGRVIVCRNEMYIHNFRTQKKKRGVIYGDAWQRLIVVHAGKKKGFIAGALLDF
jgi:hypothetical protein